MINGSIFPLFAVFFGEILEVFGLPSEQVFDEIHLWAGLFVLLGVVSGISQFSKVGDPLYTHIHTFATSCIVPTCLEVHCRL